MSRTPQLCVTSGYHIGKHGSKRINKCEARNVEKLGYLVQKKIRMIKGS